MTKENKPTLNNVDFIWFWENDHRKSNTVYIGQNRDTFRFNKDNLKGLLLEVKNKGVKFYTCDDDHEDKRYGYFYPEKNLMFDPVDQMEGDGHVHTFYKSEGNYKQL